MTMIIFIDSRYELLLCQFISLNSIRNRMTTFFRRDSTAGGRKKVKHYSYGCEDRIGKGYSSVVYRGVNELTQQTIAIKAIDMKGVKDAVSKKMLDCEIQALTKLKHDNILTCHDVVREQTHCFIVTEYCNEGDLSGLLKRKKRLGQREVLKLTKDIVGGFIELAENNFLHRDLKLANIFMNSGRAVIADFGFAKKHCGVFEREKYNVGSPLYMSPQALRRNVYTVKNDIWSIGIMIYELLHGETPWECKTEKELMDKMVKVPVRFRESLSISAPLRAFISKCLEVNEEARMSLADLKAWNNAHSYEQLAQGSMSFPLGGGKELGVVVLGEVTNRVSARSQSNVGFQSKQRQHSASTSNVEKMGMKEGRQAVGKTTIEKNNNVLMMEINSFRLLFKIYEKLKKHASDEKELLNTVGNEILQRVSSLMFLAVPQKENSFGSRGDNLGLQDAEKYFNEQINPTVKKYKTVIKEYSNKYSQQISISPQGRQVSTKGLMRDMLVNGPLTQKSSLSSDELTLVYWMIEFAQMGKEVNKEYLEGVIQAKGQDMTQLYLLDRIRGL